MTRNASRLGMGIVVGGLLAMGATVAQREIMRRAGTRLIDWETVRGIARRRLGADGAPLRTEVRDRGRGLLPRRPAADRAGGGRGDRRGAAGRARDAGGDRSARVDRPEPGHLRAALRSDRADHGQPGRGGHAGTSAGPHREPLDRQPAARLPDGVPGAQGARPVRHQPAGRRARGARPAALRGAEHPRHRREHAACRSTSSAPSSPCTRRPTPSSSRPIPWLRAHFAGLGRRVDRPAGRRFRRPGRAPAERARQPRWRALAGADDDARPSWTRSSAPRR